MKKTAFLMSIVFALVLFIGLFSLGASASEGGVVIFEDDFEDIERSKENWAIVSGESFVHFEPGYLRLEGTEEPVNFIWIEPKTDLAGFKNYEMEYHIRMPQRGQGWWGFYLPEGHIRVRVFVQNKWTAIGWVYGGTEKFVTESWYWSPNDWYQLKIVVRDSKLTMYFKRLDDDLTERYVVDYPYDLTRTYITLEQTMADLEIGYVRITWLVD